MGDVKNNDFVEEEITNKLDVDLLDNISGGRKGGEIIDPWFGALSVTHMNG